MKSKWMKLIASLFAFSLIAAACGDSDDSSGDADAAWVSALCARWGVPAYV